MRSLPIFALGLAVAGYATQLLGLAVAGCATLAVAGCATQPSLSMVQKSCDYSSRPFDETWPCVKVGMGEWRGYSDLKAYYQSVGDVAYERVKAGQMTQAEAKLTMEEARQKMLQVGLQREQGAMPQRMQTVCQHVANTLICY